MVGDAGVRTSDRYTSKVKKGNPGGEIVKFFRLESLFLYKGNSGK